VNRAGLGALVREANPAPFAAVLGVRISWAPFSATVGAFFLFLLKTGLHDFILGTLGDALSDLPFFYSFEN